MGPKARSCFVLFSTLLSAACSFIVSTSDLSTGRSVGPREDTGQTTGEAGVDDARDEPDAAPGKDADASIVDAAPDDDAGDAAVSCGLDEVCEDFEGPGLSVLVIRTLGSAVGTVDAVRPSTGKKAFHATKASPGVFSAAALELAMQPGKRITECTFSIYLDRLVSSEGLQFYTSAWLPGADAGYTLYNAQVLILFGAGSMLQFESKTPPYTQNEKAIGLSNVFGRWHHLKVIRFDKSASVVGQSLVFAENFLVSTLTPALTPTTRDRETLYIGGLSENNASGTWELFVDDVRCKVEQ